MAYERPFRTHIYYCINYLPLLKLEINFPAWLLVFNSAFSLFCCCCKHFLQVLAINEILLYDILSYLEILSDYISGCRLICRLYLLVCVYRVAGVESDDSKSVVLIA